MFLKIENLSKQYNKGKNKFEAFKELNISIDKGEFLCILGPSGCGKTTLFNIIAGLDVATQGSVFLENELIVNSSSNRAVVFQEGALFPWLNVFQNIEFGMKKRYKDRNIRNKKVVDYIKMVRLENFANAFIHELSGGMKQRVAIARAFALESEILLMDEPFSALDEHNRRLLQEELVGLCKDSDKTVLFITHNVEEAFILGSRVLIMSDSPGKIVKEYVLDSNIKKDFNSDIIKNYVEEAKKILGANNYDEDIKDYEDGEASKTNSFLFSIDNNLGTCL